MTLRGITWQQVLAMNEYFDGEPEITLDAFRRWKAANPRLVGARERELEARYAADVKAMERRMEAYMAGRRG